MSESRTAGTATIEAALSILVSVTGTPREHIPVEGPDLAAALTARWSEVERRTGFGEPRVHGAFVFLTARGVGPLITVFQDILHAEACGAPIDLNDPAGSPIPAAALAYARRLVESHG